MMAASSAGLAGTDGIDVTLGAGGAPATGCADAVVPPNSGITSTGGQAGELGVCGCDGNVYSSGDEAKVAAGGVDEYEYCRIPAHLFGCGSERCVVGQEVCHAFIDHADCCAPKGHKCHPVVQDCVGVSDWAFAACACGDGLDESCQVVPVSTGMAVYITDGVGR